MKLLAAVDLSRISNYVIEAVHRVAMATDAQMHVLYVASSLSSELTPDLSPVPNWKRGEELPAEELALGDLVQQLTEAGIETTALVRQGRPASIALEEAERIDADLIVVGSHGHGRVFDAIVGSISAEILRKSHVPVLVVPVRRR